MRRHPSALEGKRLVFTLSTGRSGTGLLARCLDELPGVAGRHEPEPHFAEVMRPALREPSLASEFWLQRKLPAIEASPEAIYVETSHLFAKGFAEPLLALGLVPDLIVLRRPPREVALSLLALGTVPARTPKGRRFLLAPDDPGVLALPAWERRSDYQLCFWYCLEMARREQQLSELFRARGAQVSQLSLAELAEGPGLRRLINELDLPRPRLAARLRSHLGTAPARNRKRHRKRAAEPVADLLSQELEVRESVGDKEALP